MFGPDEPAPTEASLGAPKSSTLDVVLATDAPHTRSGLSTAVKTAIEHQRRVEREELVSDTLRLRWLSVVGAGVWAAFAVDDWLIARFNADVRLDAFLSIRLAALVP